MADILLQFMTTAAIPSAIATTKNMVIAMSTIQSEIDRATSLNKWILGGYILALLIAAVMTFLSWWAGNRVTDLVRKEADARISESNAEAKRAGESAAQANERAGLANERAQKLEGDNTQLRTDLENATADAQARIEAARAEAGVKIEQARADAETKILEVRAEAARQVGEVQKDVARQQARAAEAEKELAQVKEYASLRLKSGEQLKVISERLKNLPRGKLKVFWAANDADAYNVADNTVEVFRMLGWQVDGPERTLEALFPIAIASENPNDGPTTAAIIEAFRAAGFDARGSSTFKLPPDRIVIVVGSQQRKLFPENPRPNE